MDAIERKEPAPDLSVLIPTWNRLEVVVAAVKSVGGGERVEIVVVDNGSPLSLFEELRAALAGNTRVRLYRNDTNLGMVKNWNRCLSLARGTWVSLLCSDDHYEPGAVERALDLLAKQGGPALVVQDPSIPVDTQDCPAGRATVRGLNLPFASGNFWHRDIVTNLGPFDERFEYSADVEFWPRVALHYPVVKVKKPFAYYRLHGSNYMWSTWRRPDFLRQMEAVSRAVLTYSHGPENGILIERELDASLFTTLLTIVEVSFLKWRARDLFGKYLLLAMSRADTAVRKRDLARALGRGLLGQRDRIRGKLASIAGRAGNPA